MAKSYYPPMHTAEHILNQTMLQLYTKERSFTTHIERKKSKVDYNYNRDLTEEEKQIIEAKVNEVIDRNLDVAEKFLNFDEAKEIFNLERLPESVGDKIRIIEVGDYDSCPCIGQHVKNTNEIGKFKIVSTSYNEDVRGIYIFDVETIEEAKALTESDPAIKAGSLVMELRTWYGSAALKEISEIHKTLEKTSVSGE